MKRSSHGSGRVLRALVLAFVMALPWAGSSIHADPAPSGGAAGWQYDASLPFGLTRGLWEDDFEIRGRGLGVAMALPLDVVQFPLRVSPARYDPGYFFGLSRAVLSDAQPEAEPAYQALILTGPLDLALLPVAAVAGLAGPDALATSRSAPEQDYAPLVRGLGSVATVPLDMAGLPLTLLGGLQGN